MLPKQLDDLPRTCLSKPAPVDGVWLGSLIRAAATRETTDSLFKQTFLVVQRIQAESATTSARVFDEWMVADDEREIKDRLAVSSTNLPARLRWSKLRVDHRRSATCLVGATPSIMTRLDHCFLLVVGVELSMMAC